MDKTQGKKLTDLFVEYMKEKGRPVTGAELMEEFEINRSSLIKTIGWLEKQDRIRVEYDMKMKRTKYGTIRKPIFGTYRYSLKP